jgi:hypothetical protein
MMNVNNNVHNLFNSKNKNCVCEREREGGRERGREKERERERERERKREREVANVRDDRSKQLLRFRPFTS